MVRKSVKRVEELSVEAAVRQDLAGVDCTSPVHASLVALAISAARKLDEGAGLAHAVVSRELRTTLEALTEGGGDDDDDGFAALVSGLSAPVGISPFS